MAGWKRRQLLALPAAGVAAAAWRDAPRPAVVEEWTFLQSFDPDPTDLIAFIEANWFAMDARAVAAGLFSHYRLWRVDGLAGDPAFGWNLIVAVGYPDPAGYDGVRAAFEAIRTAHVPVPIRGKLLQDLGRIVGSRRLVSLQARR